MKNLIISGFFLMGLLVQSYGQELLKDGDMESQGAWKIAKMESTAGEIVVAFGDAYAPPKGGSDNCLSAEFTYNSVSGTSQVMIYQPIKLEGGHHYKFEGLFADLSVTLENFWAEFMWLPDDPNGLKDVGNQTIFAGINVWNGCGPGADGSIIENSCMGDTARKGYFTIPDTITSEDTLYVGFTIGIWTDADRAFTVIFDNLSLMDSASVSGINQPVTDIERINVYPNPVNDLATIKYYIPENDNVRIQVYNLLGERVFLLLNAYQETGYHELPFNTSGIAEGSYYVSIETDNYTVRSKISIVH